jgi:hypothetical protein
MPRDLNKSQVNVPTAAQPKPKRARLSGKKASEAAKAMRAGNPEAAKYLAAWRKDKRQKAASAATAPAPSPQPQQMGYSISH